MFEIEQYEIHKRTYRVEADTEAEAEAEAEAINNLFSNSTRIQCLGGLEYVEVAEDYGLSTEDNPELTEELKALGLRFHDDTINSIGTVRKVTHVDRS